MILLLLHVEVHICACLTCCYCYAMLDCLARLYCLCVYQPIHDSQIRFHVTLIKLWVISLFGETTGCLVVWIQSHDRGWRKGAALLCWRINWHGRLFSQPARVSRMSAGYFARTNWIQCRGYGGIGGGIYFNVSKRWMQ